MLILHLFWNFSPGPPETCIFQDDFSCDGSAVLYINNENKLFVSLKLGSKINETAYDVKIVCTDAIEEANFILSNAKENGLLVSADDVDPLENFNVTAPCVDLYGKILKSNEGSIFKGRIIIEYISASNQGIEQIAIGTIAGTVCIENKCTLASEE